jgi:hypothetical protein
MIFLLLLLLISVFALYKVFNKTKQNKHGYYSYDKYSDSYDKYSNNYDNIYNSFILKNIMLDMKKDFLSYPYIDKFENKKNDLIYIFRNGRTIILRNYHDDYYLIDSEKSQFSYYTKSQFYDRIKLEPFQVSEYISFFKLLLNNSKKRYNQNNRTYDNTYNRTYNRTKYTDEQIKYQEKFWKLKKNHDARMEQLKHIKKSDPNRISLINEINVVKRKMKIYFDKSGLKMKKTK